MSMLDSKSQAMLVTEMRKSLAESIMRNSTLTESQQVESLNFVSENATYEQLLNLTMNPLRESKYLPSYVLEGAVAIASSACMTGRKVIGPNAIAEGAMRLQKKTGAVITESMLDAALELAKSNGLKIVGNCLHESFKIVKEAAEKPVLSKKAQALAESVVQKKTLTEGAKDIAKKVFGVNNIKKAKEAGKSLKLAKDYTNQKLKSGISLSAGEKENLKNLKKEIGKEVGKAALKIGGIAAGTVAAGVGTKKALKKKDKKNSK